jgi:Cu(I)/Ag(I) efflux system membrane protein CusA/SilA
VSEHAAGRGPVNGVIRFFLEQRLVAAILAAVLVLWGVMAAPFAWTVPGVPNNPVPVDAIPDLGENQQIVFTEWPGRSPQDIDDQVTYPLTVALLGVPGVRDVRSMSIFGFSSIFVIFEEGVDFYWSRSRILEKLASLPSGTLPEGVSPALGPDATALGQVFWYTLEGRDADGNPAPGWSPEELRSIQDWQVRYALAASEGVAEVASIGGFVQEYQVDVDPDAMRAYGVTLADVFTAVRQSNIDVGARSVEINKAEYLVRGLGFIENLEDLEATAVGVRDDAPVYLRDIAHITLGPAARRGALDKAGAEAVGGVVVARHGANPLAVIDGVKATIAEIAPGLPRRTLDDGTISQVTVVPFYDRTGLIHETIGTLEDAIEQQILVTILVVVVMVMHLRSSLLITGLLPISVLATFVAMKAAGVDANIVALSGIAIAVGTIVDMGIVLTENILRRLDEAGEGDDRLAVVLRASQEVGGAVLTAGLTTIVSFLPVFSLEAEEGRLFRPLAYTKTFALAASILVTLTILPAAAYLLMGRKTPRGLTRRTLGALVALGGAGVVIWGPLWAGLLLTGFGVYFAIEPSLPSRIARWSRWSANLVAAAVVLGALARAWAPLGYGRSFLANLLFVGAIVGGILLVFWLFRLVYPRLLTFALQRKAATLLAPLALVVIGLTCWLGFPRTFGWLPTWARSSEVGVALAHDFPGLGREFMPALDEGAFLYMPTTMPHASIGEAMEQLQTMDMAVAAIPEVEMVVGKLGRADTALDPAPVSMFENVITYVPEYRRNADGRLQRFRVDDDGAFVRDDAGELIEDPRGKPFRQWRDHIRTPDDIWGEIEKAAAMPGTTGAPKLQPIETRLVMLQSGFRAAMGVKVFGPDLATVERFSLEIERILKAAPGVQPETVVADRVAGKPYLEIDIDRERIARYGLSIAQVQEIIEVAIGGRRLTTTVEGRERYPVRVRYLRELRDQIETLGDVLVPAGPQRQIPLRELAEIRYERGPQVIKSEDGALVAYVTFDSAPGVAEVDAVVRARAYLEAQIASGALAVPDGSRWRFAGRYESSLRAQQRLSIVIPVSLAVIFLLLYFQFRSSFLALAVFAGVFVAWSGGFILLWLYNQPWFMDVTLLGVHLREVFQVGPVNLSTAVWVGFLALFGIATDDGVVMATRLRQAFAERRTETVAEIRAATVAAGKLRIRACLMTTATTIIALLPVLTSTGRGSDVMIPMAIPAVGGMLVALVTLFVVPVLFCAAEEWRVRVRELAQPPATQGATRGVTT